MDQRSVTSPGDASTDGTEVAFLTIACLPSRVADSLVARISLDGVQTLAVRAAIELTPGEELAWTAR